ncbi:MAG: penicillin-binding protein 1A [Rhodospirillales bacterium]|nr:penicillin-binding protein 1A [Rhodospirillales bacterium]
MAKDDSKRKDKSRDDADDTQAGGPVGRRKAGRPRRWGRTILKWVLILGIWEIVALGALVAWVALSLPDLSNINNFNRRPSLTFVAADGQTVATYGDLYGGAVDLKDMPPWLPQAVLATEDRRFYSHYGIDPVGLARAAATNLRAGRVVQGGSTITQQLAKNVYLSSERTFWRKIQETLLAFWLERKFTKDQILTIYLNRVYLGAGTYGVEAAAQRYFGKSVRQLSRHEAAIIAGLLKAPSRYAPTADLERAKARARDVLTNMVEAGYMNAQQAVAASREPLRLAGLPAAGRGARYFADWLLDQVPGYVGYIDRDLVIVTTLDSHLQRSAETAVAALLDRESARSGVGQAALIALSPDGAVRAMIGGRDYGESQFNRAVNAQRQPGSAFKPFVYLAAVEAGMRPDDRISDAPVTVGDWSPRNYDSGQRGEITLREALARSVNTATVRAAQRAGIDRVIADARRLGVTSELRRELPLALGASEVNLLELTAAYAPFANGGNGVLPYAITEIRDTAGNVIYRRAGSGPGRVIQGGALAAMNDMLTAVIAGGTGRAATLDRPAAGKTGTSQDFRDAWFIGYTADYVAGVWLGNDNDQPMDRVTGGSLSARLWRAFMLEAHRGLPARPLNVAPVPLAAADPATGSSGALDRLLDSIFGGTAAPAGDARPRPPGGVNPRPANQTPLDPDNRPEGPRQLP